MLILFPTILGALIAAHLAARIAQTRFDGFESLPSLPKGS